VKLIGRDRRYSGEEAHVLRSFRLKAALVLLGSAIVFNIIILARGDESPGWPIAAIVLMSAAGISLLAERREP
jgi:hypothetical protein